MPAAAFDPEDVELANKLMKTPKGRVDLYNAARTLVSQGRTEWAEIAEYTVQFEMSERQRCAVDLAKQPFYDYERRYWEAAKDPIERAHMYMKHEQQLHQGRVTKEVFDEMVADLKKFGPVPDDSPIGRHVGTYQTREEALPPTARRSLPKPRRGA